MNTKPTDEKRKDEPKDEAPASAEPRPPSLEDRVARLEAVIQRTAVILGE